MITKEEVARVADLARLDLREKETEKFTEQFNTIFEYMKELDELNLNGVEAAFHITELQNVFREDVQRESLNNRSALYNAPEASEGAFKVPKMI